MIVIVLPDIAEEDHLMMRARRGDKEAMRAIYQRYFSPVYNFIRLRVDDGPQADDLTSEVFVKLITAFHAGKAPRQSLRGWLFRVARNVLYDHFGGGQKYTEEALEEWVPASQEDSDPEIRLLQLADSRRVRQAIERLSTDQQEVLVLRFAQGLSVEETADLMGKNVNTVKSLQFRAVNGLRKMLGSN
ncbi:MAG: sigma-70 family RNA polymerase sigma factor [Anaerolineae bacterium]|nr:sigma-70 family RNA polymerase sigma factor [Anaerolineae bacterium]